MGTPAVDVSVHGKAMHILEFDEDFVTQCVEAHKPVFEWDGSNGPIEDYLLKPQAGAWKLKIISSYRTPNRGQVIAVPTGRRTADIYKKAKCEELTGMGFNEGFVKVYLSRSRNIRYNMELDVICFVAANYLMNQTDFDEIIRAPIRRLAAIGLGYKTKLTQTRFEFAMAIIQAIRVDDPVIQFAIDHRGMPDEHITQILKPSLIHTPSLMADLLGYNSTLHDNQILRAVNLLAYDNKLNR